MDSFLVIFDIVVFVLVIIIAFIGVNALYKDDNLNNGWAIFALIAVILGMASLGRLLTWT